MKKLFGTDGIRGVAGTFPLDPGTVGYIGLALGEILTKSGNAGRVVVGHDTRESGEWITGKLISSLTGCGILDIHNVGVITTPGLAFLTRLHQFDLGVMISASHNPYQDNGIKIFSRDGFKLSDELEADLERSIYGLIESQRLAPAIELKNISHRNQELIQDYRTFLINQAKTQLTSFEIGLDVCNGSAFSIAPEVFRELGANLRLINDAPNGRNINDGCGSLHLESLIDLVSRFSLDFGVAFDGDADRSLSVTPSGRVFDGDFVLYAFSRYLRQTGQLKSGSVVGTVMTNFALEKALQEEGLELLRAPVGDKYVLEEMIRAGSNLGGEPSGHVILRDYHTTGDGILTTLKLAEILLKKSLSLDEVAKGFRPFPQVLDGIRIRQKVPLSESPEVLRVVEKTRSQLGSAGRIVVRYSGTEPILRIMAEGENLDHVKRLVAELKSRLLEILFSYDARPL